MTPTGWMVMGDLCHQVRHDNGGDVYGWPCGTMNNWVYCANGMLYLVVGFMYFEKGYKSVNTGRAKERERKRESKRERAREIERERARECDR